MKINLSIVFFIYLIIIGFGCKKKSYYCSCQFSVSVYHEDPHGPGFYTYYDYSSDEKINEKLTKKQAIDVCNKTGTTLATYLKKSNSNSSAAGGCQVK